MFSLVLSKVPAYQCFAKHFFGWFVSNGLRNIIPKETSNNVGAKSPKINSKWRYCNLVGWCATVTIRTYSRLKVVITQNDGRSVETCPKWKVLLFSYSNLIQLALSQTYINTYTNNIFRWVHVTCHRCGHWLVGGVLALGAVLSWSVC